MTFPSSPFSRHLGVSGGAGRLVPSLGAPFGGSFSMVLGADAIGVVRTLTVGDFFAIDQVADVSSGSFLRFKVQIRPPVSMPAGVYWQVTFSCADVAAGTPDGTSPRVTYSILGTNNRVARRVDIAIPLTGIVTTSTARMIARLELAGTAGSYDVELPGIYLDSVIVDTAVVRPTPINRLPEPDDTAVPIDSDIVLELADPNASVLAPGNIDLTLTQVYVGGIIAYDGNAGGFQTGFTGPDSTVVTLDGTRTTRITIDPNAPFTSSIVMPVRVFAAYRGSPNPPVQYDYTFTTEDLIAPTLVAASAVARRTVRVVASEPLLVVDPAGVDDALNPANWVLSIASTSLDDGLPAATPNVLSVSIVDDVTFDLALDSETTRGAMYLVTAGPLSDVVGNFMIAPNDRAFTLGYLCPPPDGRDFQLLDMLPGMNVNEDDTDDLKKFIACFQEVTDLLLCDIDEWTDILDPDFAAERFVDAMLADLGNPFSFVLSSIDKRRLLRVLVPIYQLKGTDPGIINSTRFFLGLDVTISVPAFGDTWELGIDELGLGTFLGTSSLKDRLGFYVVSGIVLTDEQRLRIREIVIYMKRAETHFLGIIEPTAPPPVPNHWEIGLSELGVNTLLH